MNRTHYKWFKDEVKHANESSDVWWMGANWLDLTDKQYKEMIEILKCKPACVKVVTLTDGKWLEVPSGLRFKV